MKIVKNAALRRILTELDELTFRFEDIPRMLRRAIDEILVDSGLSRTQWRLMGYVLRESGLTQTELARLLELERASVGSAIDSLSARGLVVREPVPEDRRAWAISATPEAEALLASLREAISEIYAQTFRGLTAQELQLLRRMLDQITTNLSRG
ncbi:MarR family transcriptional regulator [Hyphomonas sp.]|uniref:MarR family winged helix-turn-helix transcriptional regulator n=1 Tax=Hyphomonas sp. TaxID=87 RepID=UPI0025C2143F|nr:MarR family transcriptional regulator [Hyphomonas sp.]MBI1399563.1 MarR family transcriptional regulator [Hyphomonas sp.]